MKDLPTSVLNSRLTLLSDEKCQAIYDAALSIIADMGMVVPHVVARELLVAAGASVEGEDLVRIPRETVAQARKTDKMARHTVANLAELQVATDVAEILDTKCVTSRWFTEADRAATTVSTWEGTVNRS